MSPPRVRFGVFELDLEAGDLYKRGVRIHLREQPFRILAALLERPGEVVSRDELRERVWPADTHVDFDAGLNAALANLREILGDTAKNPRFIETAPRRGYRFIGSIESAPAVQPPVRGRRRVLVPILSLAAAALCVLAVALWLRKPAPAPLTAVPLTSYPGSERYPSFSPDGNQVCFSWNGPGQDNVDVYVKLVGPGEAIRLTQNPADDIVPRWSPDGRWIAFFRTRPKTIAADLMLIPALGGAERKIGEVALRSLSPWLTWTPDSQWLAALEYAAGKEPAIGLISIQTGQRRTLITPKEPVELMLFYPAFSADGRFLAYVQGRDLHVVALSSEYMPQGPPRRVTHDPTVVHGSPQWTPDNRELIFSTGQPVLPRLWRVGVTGSSQPVPLGLSGWQHVLSRQGGRLAFVKENLDGNIWRVDLASTGVPRPETLIDSTYDDSNPDFSPDGRYIVFDSARSGNTELWIANSDGSQPRQLTSFGAPLGSPRWSPDGARIAFDGEASGSGDVYLIDVSGGKPRRLTDHPARDAVPTWSRDGQWIYFYSTRTGSHQIWKQRVDGGDAVQVTRNGGRLGFESPDGRFLYFVKQGATGLWRIPADGGDEALVVKDVSYRFFIHGNLVYYHQSERPPDTPSFHLDSGSIRVFDFKTGAGRVLYRPEKPVRFGMSVSPDGRWLAYGQADSTGSDIMLVEGFQ